MQLSDSQRITAKTLLYLNEHIGSDTLITVDDVKKVLHIKDKQKLNMALYQCLGIKSLQLIIHLKMTKAYYYYHEQGLTELDTARRLGYSDAASLAHAFYRYTKGQTLKTCELRHLKPKLQTKIKALLTVSQKNRELLVLNFTGIGK